MTNVEVGPDKKLDVRTVQLVAAGDATAVRLSKKAIGAVRRSRRVVERLLEERTPVYGLTTGFGKFKDVCIDAADVAELQRNLIISHSVGVGEVLSREAVRASLFVRINSLAKGYSGVRLELLDMAIDLLNKDVTPVVPSQGSVGASGDLAPLSHMGLVLMGEGEAFYKGKRMSARAALRAAGISPIAFTAKEGLAWNNGTSVMLGIMCLAVGQARVLADIADIACALTLEAVRGTQAAFRKEIHELRPHPGQITAAANIRKLVRGSKLIERAGGMRVQDSYSLRCAPQVHGASRETLAFVERIVATELNAVTDNPLIFPDTGEALSGGNFHGEPLAQAADALCIALTEWGSISERRTSKLVDGSTNEGLPLFLIAPESAGLHSGLMMPQYTAAALVSENKVLSHPASVDSIPTSANQEDHVSMGNIGARKAMQVAQNTAHVIAIEFLTAAQAIDFRGAHLLGTRTGKAYESVRTVSSFISKDRILHHDIEAVRKLVVAPSFAKSIFT